MEWYERLVDDFGRIIIPWQIREKLGIKKHDALKIYEKNGEVIINVGEKEEVR